MGTLKPISVLTLHEFEYYNIFPIQPLTLPLSPRGRGGAKRCMKNGLIEI
jgi:hypothetical protein